MKAEQIVAWAEKYRPKTAAGLVGNEESVSALKEWLKGWKLSRRPTKACLLVGPPGVGKTTLARAAANDLHYRVVEMNASDVRTEKAIESMLSPASTSSTLDVFSSDIRGNLILMDEVDGVFGREDRGGLGAILSLVKKPCVPMVLTANNVDDERFDDLKKGCLVIGLHEVRPRILVMLISHILAEEGRSIPREQVWEIARGCHGDIRSAINDIQALVGGGTVSVFSKRTRELNETETVEGLFESGRHSQTRRVLNETEIPLYRDELLLLVHDILPYVYTSPNKLAQAYESLSRTDIGYGRIGAGRSRGMAPPPFNMPRRDSVPQWNLLPIALNELSSVGIQKPDNDVEHALQIALRVSQSTVDRYQYRLWALDHLCRRIARACHTSKRTALHDILPFLVAIFRADREKGRGIAISLELEERDIDFLLSESKTQPQMRLTGPQEILDPTGFKLPYMGKDKFIQLMRIGLSYDRSSGKFVVRRQDNLDSIEERLADIISKPVRFARRDQPIEQTEGKYIKECYIDGQRKACDECEFVDDCPTHTTSALKFCLCDSSFSDPKAYDKYVAKNIPAELPTKIIKRKASARPSSKKRKSSPAAD